MYKVPKVICPYSWDNSKVVKTRGGKVKAVTPPLKEMHRRLYGVLKEAYGLSSKIAQDCYRNALAIAKSWLGNGARERRPVRGSVAVWLTRGQSYHICGDHVEIADGIRLEIVDMDKRYEGYEYREAPAGSTQR